MKSNLQEIDLNSINQIAVFGDLPADGVQQVNGMRRRLRNRQRADNPLKQL